MLTQKMMPGSEFTTVYPVLYPPYADRAAWAALSGAARWKAAGDAALQDADTLPRLPLSLWLRFTQNGDRTVWEHAYFARRRTLCALVMAEAVTGAGSYLPAIADLAWAICEESAWQLPAHNSYIRDTPQLPLPDVTRPIVDLFAAETGALIATVYGLLGAALDGYAPGFSVRLKGEVERRVLAPYRTAHFWWMGNGEEPMCNWTPWCTQNVLLAAAQCAPAETLPVYVKQAAYSIDCFLKDYGEDGCCSEGAQYYRHAALTMFNALDLLCRIAPGVFDGVWAEPKIRNMAEYIVNMHIAGPYYLNFADCSPLAGARGVREFLFGQRVASAPLMTLAARDWADALQQPDPDRLHHPDDSEGINLYYHIQTALAEQKVLAFAQSAAPALPPLVAAAIEDIRRNYAGLYGVEELSERLGVSKSHLVRAFTAALGVSPGRYLTSVRIEAAMRLLLHREYTLDVIASLCGFSGANYLCRVFKKTTGRSPTQWRAMAGRSALPELSPEQQRLEQELFI